MLERISRGEVEIDRMVFMADTCSRFMAAQPDLQADAAFKRADSLWRVLVANFADQEQQQQEPESGEAEEDGGNVVQLRRVTV